MRNQIIVIAAALLMLSGCAQKSENNGDGYRQISQEEAAEMMRKDDGPIIVDVRRQDEFDAGHIPGAVLIPNESIAAEMPEELPDRDQIILVYCRSGNRSKQAAQKLAAIGYTNVYEFGGINTWKGEIVTGEPVIWTDTDTPVRLRYERMYEYGAETETEDLETIQDVTKAVKALQIGAVSDMATDDYTDILIFSFADGHMIRLEFEAENWVSDGVRREAKGLDKLRAVLNEMIRETTQEEGSK